MSNLDEETTPEQWAEAKQDIIETLEGLLEQAKNGELAFLIAAAHLKDYEEVSFCVVGLSPDQKVYDSLEQLKAGFSIRCASTEPEEQNVMLIKL